LVITQLVPVPIRYGRFSLLVIPFLTSLVAFSFGAKEE
jgi:hypothetical protein